MLQRFETRSSDPGPNNHLIAVPMTCQSAISHNWSGWQRSRREEFASGRISQVISALYTCAEKKSSGRYDGDLEVPIFFDKMRWEPFAERAATPSLTSTFGRRGEFHRYRFGQRPRAAADVMDAPGMKPRTFKLAFADAIPSASRSISLRLGGFLR